MIHDFGNYSAIDRLQIHSHKQANEFFSAWRGDVFSLRFESVTLAPDRNTWGIDAILFDAISRRFFTVLAAISTSTDHISFPGLVQCCPKPMREKLAARIAEILERSPRSGEIVAFADERLNISPKDLPPECAVPGLCDYMTAVNHIKRYLFVRDRLLPGNVIDCECGTGYGATLMHAGNDASVYIGVDTDVRSLQFATGLNWQARVRFQGGAIGESSLERAHNVVSLETMENASDPHRLIEDLIEQIAVDGQLILSVPAERWAGSHLNAAHITNWDYRRFEHLVDSYFESSRIFQQELSLIGTNTFGRSEIFDRSVDTETDETFIAVLKQPRATRTRKRLVIRRDHALGDTILATPVAQSAKQRFPDRDIVVVTRHTQVFQANPFVDIVATTRFRTAEGDHVIDLNGAYERQRHLHIIEAYSKAAQLPLGHCKTTLYPAAFDYRHLGEQLMLRWGSVDIAHVLAVHPQCTSPDRIWPVEHWRTFISLALQHSTAGVLVVGAGKDFDLEALGLDKEPRAISFVNRADLLTTAAAIDLADLLVAPDSGLSHVAAAMNTPAIVLFGMADPKTRVSLDGCAVGVWSPIECRGCITDIPPTAPPLCKFGTARCMEEISPDTVARHYKRMINGTLPYTWRRKLRSTGLDIDVPSFMHDTRFNSSKYLGVLRHFFA